MYELKWDNNPLNSAITASVEIEIGSGYFLLGLDGDDLLNSDTWRTLATVSGLNTGFVTTDLLMDSVSFRIRAISDTGQVSAFSEVVHLSMQDGFDNDGNAVNYPFPAPPEPDQPPP